MNPGQYNLDVQKQGFSASKVTDQKVDVGQVLTLNVALQLGSTATAVEVQANSGADLQTTTATVGTTITGPSIMEVPNLGRDANAFITLQPGVTPGGNAAGAVTDQNTFQLDGGNNSNDMDGTSATYTQSSGYVGSAASGGSPSGVIPTPAESIEEFKVATNNQTADFNGASGGQIQMGPRAGRPSLTERSTTTIWAATSERTSGIIATWLRDPCPTLPCPPATRTVSAERSAVH